MVTPTRVGLPGPAIAIAVGDAHACALLDTDHVWCWGDNSAAQLGLGSTDASRHATPSMVQKLPSAGMARSLDYVGQIAAGGRTTCAIVIGEPHVWCWGANDFGQAGAPLSASPVTYGTPIPW